MMSKIFVLAPRENWICDRIAGEWYENCNEISTKNVFESDIVWLLAGWCWDQIPLNVLNNKKVVVTIHHVVPEKFNQEKINDFLLRDRFVDLYHVPNDKTYNIVSGITKKPVKVIGYWFDKKKWFYEEKRACREKLGLPNDDFIVGSFQRDTEGGDLITPKLEKGPDLFCDFIESIKKDNLHVLLGGWRRQYVISRLKKSQIPYSYFELANLETLRLMYCSLDLYGISSRYEGGPQSALEASGMSIPIVSTDVGMVSDILHPDCIFETLDPNFYPSDNHLKFNFEQVMKFEIKSHKELYVEMFKEIL